MAAITLLRQESNLGFFVDRRISTTDTTIYLRFFNKVTGAAVEPNASNRTNLVVTVDKDNDNHEIMILGTVGAASGGVSTCTNVVRFVAFNGVNLSAGTGKEHQAEAEGGCADVVNMWQQLYDVMAGTSDTGANTFGVGDNSAADIKLLFANDQTLQPYIYYDESGQRPRAYIGDDALGGANNDWEISCPIGTTAELAAMSNLPSVGMIAGDTTLGEVVFREGGAWVQKSGGGSVPDSTTTVAGKVEIATQAEVDAGTDTGGTGAATVAPPSTIAEAVQESTWTYKADAEASDTYAITLVPAIDGYVEGQVFYFKANTANTGAATLNVNAKGAIAIKKAHDQDLETGDIESGQIVEVCYDGTNFQMLSQTAVPIVAVSPSCQAGSATYTGLTSGNLDIDVTPFDSGDTVKLDIYMKLTTVNDDAADACAISMWTMSGIVGGEYSWWSQYNSAASTTLPVVWAANAPSLYGGTWSVSQSSASGTGNTSITVSAPAWSGNNIRIAYTISKTGGTGTGLSSASITVAVTATKLA